MQKSRKLLSFSHMPQKSFSRQISQYITLVHNLILILHFKCKSQQIREIMLHSRYRELVFLGCCFFIQSTNRYEDILNRECSQFYLFIGERSVVHKYNLIKSLRIFFLSISKSMVIVIVLFVYWRQGHDVHEYNLIE